MYALVHYTFKKRPTKDYVTAKEIPEACYAGDSAGFVLCIIFMRMLITALFYNLRHAYGNYVMSRG